MSDLQIRVTTGGGNTTTEDSEADSPSFETSGDFDRFEELTRKLLAVTKDDLKEQLAES